jgi:hypothetical protein
VKKSWLVLAVLLCGCTSAERSQISAIGGSQHIKLFTQCGSVVQEWDSDGVAHTEARSDGWYFTDKATGKLVRLSGTVVITQN